MKIIQYTCKKAEKGIENIYVESSRASCAVRNKKVFNTLMYDTLSPGDELHIISVESLAFLYLQIFDMLELIRERQIHLVVYSISDKVLTDTEYTRLIDQVEIKAKQEHKQKSERMKKTFEETGKPRGRPGGISHFDEIKALTDQNISRSRIAKKFNVSLSQVSKIKSLSSNTI